jgi:hypothetical protein
MSIFGWIFFLILLSAVYGGISAAPWLPSKGREVELLVKKLSQRKLRTIIDLGCGDGKIIIRFS